MKTRYVVLVALTAAVMLTSVAAAGPDATKQRVQIDMKYPGKTFTLTPLQPGAIERDSGTQGCSAEPDKGEALRDGQESWPWVCRAWVFNGKRGKLVLRSQYTWIEAGGPYNVATGTWRVMSGTGQYANAVGGGRNAHVGTLSIERARYQGFLTAP
jgi:hypothetical protein